MHDTTGLEGRWKGGYPLPGFSCQQQLHSRSPKLPGGCLSVPLSVAAQHVESHPALTDVVFGDFVHAGGQSARPAYLHA